MSSPGTVVYVALVFRKWNFQDENCAFRQVRFNIPAIGYLPVYDTMDKLREDYPDVEVLTLALGDREIKARTEK